MSRFKVGAGIACLDYPLDQYPAMCFFAVCEDKHDDCFCRAIAIENDDRRIIIMAYDLSDIPEAPDLEKKISEATGVPEDDIIITVTHNHTSLCDRGAIRARNGKNDESFRPKMFRIETEASIKAAKSAVESMRPAKYGYGQINSYIAANEVTRNPQIGLYEDPNGNGYIDNTLAILKFVDENDDLICVLMNHPCHATCAMGNDFNGKPAISGNFTGVASRFVESYYGGGAVAAWTSGAAGNLHPIRDGHGRIDYTDGYVMNTELPDGTGFVMMEQTGRQHGIDAVNCIEKITEYTDDIEIRHIKDKVKIETQKRADSTGERPPFGPRIDYGTDVKSNQSEPAAPFVRPVMVDDPDHPAELLMEMLVLGDTAIVCFGCEMFCQIGKAIKDAVPAKNTIVITHTPGYIGGDPLSVGYLVDKSSADSNLVKCFRNLKPGFYDDMLVEKSVAMYKEAIS